MAKIKYPLYCCQTCGEQIGYLGRALSVFKIFHKCPEENYTVQCVEANDTSADVQVTYADGTTKDITILCIKGDHSSKQLPPENL